MSALPKEHEVTLRAMEPEDLDLLYQIENDQQLWDVGNTNVPYSRYVLHDFVAHSTGDIYADGQVRLIIENGVGETVGLADLINFDAKNRRAELGIVIVRDFRHQGYGTATLQRLSVYALRVLHLHQLYAVISTDNTTARRLFKKAGFTPGTLLRHWLYDGRDYHDAELLQLML